MSNTLVIVESPAKAKTIGKFLGKIYSESICWACPRFAKSQLGVDVDNDLS